LRTIRIIEIVNVTPIGRRRHRHRNGLHLLFRVRRPPCAHRAGDVDVVTGLIHREAKIKRADGAVLPHDNLIRLKLSGGLEREDTGVARPPQLLGRKPVAGAEINLLGHLSSVGYVAT